MNAVTMARGFSSSLTWWMTALSISPMGRLKSRKPITVGLVKMVSGQRISAMTAVVCGFSASSARPCTSTRGSLSTYTTRAAGLTAWAISWVFCAVGSPEPRSRNWSMPRADMYLTARPSVWRFMIALVRQPGNTVIARSATARSHAKLSLPPRTAS